MKWKLALYQKVVFNPVLNLTMKRLFIILTLVGLIWAQQDEEKTEENLEEQFEILQRGAIFDSETGKRRYDNYEIIRVNPETDDHLDVLQFLDKGNKT